jgi:hypothetical protein
MPTVGGFPEATLVAGRFGAAGFAVADPVEAFFVVGRFGAAGFRVAGFVVAALVVAAFVPGRLRAARFAGPRGVSATGSGGDAGGSGTVP